MLAASTNALVGNNMSQIIHHETLPTVKETKCGNSMASFPSIKKPTADWVCGKLRTSFEDQWAQCEEFTSKTIPNMGMFPTDDKTFFDSYTSNFKIDGSESKVEHIRTWFKYFCPSDDQTTEENFNENIENSHAQTTFPNQGRAAKGNGPYGVFPGFEGHVSENTDLFLQLMYEISETQWFCQHRAMKGYYYYEKFEDENNMKVIMDEWTRQAAGW
jgi:hypothetical protein